MKRSLETNKLFGIRKTAPKTVKSTASTNVTVAQHNNHTIEKAFLEAERKKADAITILRRYTLVR